MRRRRRATFRASKPKTSGLACRFEPELPAYGRSDTSDACLRLRLVFGGRCGWDTRGAAHESRREEADRDIDYVSAPSRPQAGRDQLFDPPRFTRTFRAAGSEACSMSEADKPSSFFASLTKLGSIARGSSDRSLPSRSFMMRKAAIRL